MQLLSSILGTRQFRVSSSLFLFLILVSCGQGEREPETQRTPPPPPVVREPESSSPLTVLRRSAGELSITIDQVQANRSVSSRVTGLAEGAVGDFKVVVYVHTDQWYIHPYAGQGEGMSWTRLGRDLRWSIQTVKREYVADQVAALLIDSKVDPPATARNLPQIPSRAWVVIKGAGDL